MTCQNPRVIYVRRHMPINAGKDEDVLHQYNKPSMTPRAGWQQLIVPCGECDECRIDKANDWATRITNEAEMWNNRGIFVTLSYNNPNLPMKNGLTTLKKKDIQDFKKRLRKYAKKYKLPFMEWENPYTGKIERPIRTFECGEYGHEGTREAIGGNPHYHMIIFNWDPEDLIFDKYSKKSGLPIYKSKIINKIWGKGYCPVGRITYESASYVARYTMKKNGLAKVKRKYYFEEELNEKTGEIKTRKKWHNIKGKQEPEFLTMSQGIGRTWFIKNIDSVRYNDAVLIKGKSGTKIKRVPRYYRKIWQQIDWLDYERWRRKIQIKIEAQEPEIIKRYNLPDLWLDEQKLYWIQKYKIENSKIRREMLSKRNVA